MLRIKFSTLSDDKVFNWRDLHVPHNMLHTFKGLIGEYFEVFNSKFEHFKVSKDSQPTLMLNTSRCST